MTTPLLHLPRPDRHRHDHNRLAIARNTDRELRQRSSCGTISPRPPSLRQIGRSWPRVVRCAPQGIVLSGSDLRKTVASVAAMAPKGATPMKSRTGQVRRRARMREAIGQTDRYSAPDRCTYSTTSMSSAFDVIRDPRFAGRVAVGSALSSSGQRPPSVRAGPTLCPLTSRSMMEVMSPPERNGDG